MPVHVFGQSCEMDAIVDIAKKYNLKIIEDCAEAHLEGAIGLDRLENRDFIMNTRKANAKYLTENLSDTQEYLQLPYYPDCVDHCGFYVGCHHGLKIEHLDKIVDTVHQFLKR